MKQNNIWKSKLDYQSEFSRWANNHNGWAKMKKFDKRLAKRRLKQELRKDLEYESTL